MDVYGTVARTIRHAAESDIPALHALWAAAFPADTPALRARFFAAVRLPEECLVAAVSGTPVAMAFSLPATLHGTRDLPLRYLYAVATHPAHRSRGHAAALLAAAGEEARRAGCVGVFLRPGEPSLAAYYARHGYRPWGRRRTIQGPAAGDGQVTPLLPAVYQRRTRFLVPLPFVRWEPRFVAFAADAAAPGGAFAFSACGHSSFALAEPQGDVLLVHEWLGEGEPQPACAALAAAQGCARFVARLPAAAGEGEPFTWLYPLMAAMPPAAYCGLTLD